jgi:hypothetical protein
MHAVIDETRVEYLFEYTERIVNAQRVRGLAESDTRNGKGWSPLDEHDLYAASRQGRSSRQAADTAADHQNTPNLIHGSEPIACFVQSPATIT